MGSEDIGMAIFLAGFVGGPLLCGWGVWMWKKLIPILYGAVIQWCKRVHKKQPQHVKMKNQIRGRFSFKKQVYPQQIKITICIVQTTENICQDILL